MKFNRKIAFMMFIALFIASAFAVEVTASPPNWSVQYMIDQSQTVGGYSQFSDPRNTRGLALSPDGRYLYAGYNNPNGVNINKHDKQVRKIDTTVSDYTGATVAILQGDRGKAIATDDKGRVYLAEGSDTDTKDGKGIHVYDAALSTWLWTISSLTKPEGVAATREGTTLFLYATDRSLKTLTKFAIIEGSGVSITNVAVQWSISVTGASELRGVEVDPNGKIWMADFGGNKVFRVNSDSSSLTSATVTKAMDISFGYGKAYVTQYTTRTITVLKQDDLSYVETLTPPWATLELDPDGQSGGGALTGIAFWESSGVLYVANEAGQTADEHSIYGRIDGESGYIGAKYYTDMTHDDNDPILKMAFPRYYLTVNTDPVGLVTIPGEGWYDESATATLSAPPVSGSYRFWGWDIDGALQGTANPIDVLMDANHTATAHYSDSAVGGEWSPINTAQTVTPWIALAFLAVAFAAAGSHRLLKKRL